VCVCVCIHIHTYIVFSRSIRSASPPAQRTRLPSLRAPTGICLYTLSVLFWCLHPQHLSPPPVTYLSRFCLLFSIRSASPQARCTRLPSLLPPPPVYVCVFVLHSTSHPHRYHFGLVFCFLFSIRLASPPARCTRLPSLRAPTRIVLSFSPVAPLAPQVSICILFFHSTSHPLTPTSHPHRLITVVSFLFSPAAHPGGRRR